MRGCVIGTVPALAMLHARHRNASKYLNWSLHWDSFYSRYWLPGHICTLHAALVIMCGNWSLFGLVSQRAVHIITLFAVAWLAADRKNILTLLRAACASGALASMYGISQYFGWDPLLPATAYQAGEGTFTIVRPPGTLGHADYFAAWLVVVGFFSIALPRLERS